MASRSAPPAAGRTVRSWASSPRLTSSSVTAPAAMAGRDSTMLNSRVVACRRAATGTVGAGAGAAPTGGAAGAAGAGSTATGPGAGAPAAGAAGALGLVVLTLALTLTQTLWR